MRKLKKLFSLALALVMCLGLVVPASAAYVSDKAGVNLNAGERRIYNALEKVMLEIYAGERLDTQTAVTFRERELGWSAGELGYTWLDNNDQSLVQAVMDKLNARIVNIYIALEYNHPFELFFDSGGYVRYNFHWYNTGNELWLTDLDIALLVSPDYQWNSDTTVNPYERAKAVAGEEVARRIVAENAGKSNYEKLEAYRDAICRLTDYDEERASYIDTDAYVFGYPSQASSVFDGDPNTLTICVGYARAFKYLCDLSDFDGNVCCYLASGNLDMGSLGGGGHTWNVVRMEDGKYYLTDITASDSGIYGKNHPLLACSNEPLENYNYQTALYTYYDYNYGLYTDGWLPMISATPYEPGHAVTPTQTEQPQQPAGSSTASPTNDKLEVNGAAADPTVYKIGGSNYFKIRDVAALLNGTEKQFAVGYDGSKNAVTATTGQGYAKQSSDLTGAPSGGNQTAVASNDAIYVNGEKIAAEVYKINGSNYFKLRDLGKALNFYVGWTAERGMYIETGKPYSE